MMWFCDHVHPYQLCLKKTGSDFDWFCAWQTVTSITYQFQRIARILCSFTVAVSCTLNVISIKHPWSLAIMKFPIRTCLWRPPCQQENESWTSNFNPCPTFIKFRLRWACGMCWDTCLQSSVWNYSFTGQSEFDQICNPDKRLQKKNMYIVHGVTRCMKAPTSLLSSLMDACCILLFKERRRDARFDGFASSAATAASRWAIQKWRPWVCFGKRPRLHLWNSEYLRVSPISSFIYHSFIHMLAYEDAGVS